MDYMNYTVAFPYSTIYGKVLHTSEWIEYVVVKEKNEVQFYLKKDNVIINHNIRGRPSIITKYAGQTDIYHYINGYLHNTRGPAIIYGALSQMHIYYLNGNYIREECTNSP